MVSISVLGVYGWGNSSSQRLGVLGSSPSYRSGLGTLFCRDTTSLRPLLVNKDQVPKPTQWTNDQGQGWAWLGAAKP